MGPGRPWASGLGLPCACECVAPPEGGEGVTVDTGETQPRECLPFHFACTAQLCAGSLLSLFPSHAFPRYVTLHRAALKLLVHVGMTLPPVDPAWRVLLGSGFGLLPMLLVKSVNLGSSGSSEGSIRDAACGMRGL